MNFIKKFFLDWKIRQALQLQAGVKRQTPNYDEANTVGILLKTNNLSMAQSIQKFISQLIKDGKRVSILHYIGKNDPTIDLGFQHYSFSEKQIDSLGNINLEVVETFIAQNFDFLYCVSKEDELPFQYILAKSKAKCRVGKFDSNPSFYELMINLKPEEDIDVFAKQALYYTQSIIYN